VRSLTGQVKVMINQCGFANGIAELKGCRYFSFMNFCGLVVKNLVLSAWCTLTFGLGEFAAEIVI